MTHRQREVGNGITETVFTSPRGLRPVLICGLPGSGYVGKLAADHLVDTFKGKLVAQYTCDSFPPQINVREDGVAEPLRAKLYFARATNRRSLFIFTADAQPTTSEGEYELADAVVTHARKSGVKTVYTLAAYITGAFSSEQKVFGAATSRKMLEEVSSKGATLMKGGGISGMNGIMIGMAALRGLDGVCLLGETSGYLVDAGASKAVLEMLARLVDLPIDTTKLKDKAEETSKVIRQLQGMAEQARESAGQQPRREPRPEYIG